MAEQLFKSGDVVELKSGGIPMTVEVSKESNDGSTYIVDCAWFVGNVSKKDRFFQDSLKIYEAEDSSSGFFVT